MCSTATSPISAPRLSFAWAGWSEELIDWVEGHLQAFDYFGGAPALVVPDNPKVAVIKACFYDPQVNRTYAELIRHYDTAILPARPRKPRDKAKSLPPGLSRGSKRAFGLWSAGCWASCATAASTAWPT